MKKVKITADGVLAIVKGIFNDEDVNTVITDSTVSTWRGKTVQEALNVEYYTFKHRPVSSEEIIAEKIRQGQNVNMLESLNRSFCLLSVSGVERLYSKDVDMLTVTASLEYWIQTSKIKLLEDVIEDCNIKLSGMRIPVAFGEETRKAVVIFSKPEVTDIQTGTPCGEMAVVEITINLLLYPDVVSYSDYELEFTYADAEGISKTTKVPVSSFSFVGTMTQKSVPGVENPTVVGSINLSRATSFVLVFDGYNNDFINFIIDRTLQSNATVTDNNQTLLLTVRRSGKGYAHNVVIRDHQVTVNADTGNETHTLSLVTGGVGNVIA